MKTSYEARESSIHGKGLFSIETITKGSVIGHFSGRKVKNDGTHVLWVQEDDDSWYALKVTNELKYLNHSKKPNAEIGDNLELVALKKILPNKEITIHYGDDWK